jgi:hypothetical protein
MSELTHLTFNECAVRVETVPPGADLRRFPLSPVRVTPERTTESFLIINQKSLKVSNFSRPD